MAQIKTVNEVSHERIDECVDAAIAEFRDAILPIYGTNERGRPFHIASSILIRIDDRPVMLTAAHALRQWVGQTTLYTAGRTFERIPLTFDITRDPNDDWTKDRYDFAAGLISEDLAGRLVGVKYITEGEISRYVGDGKGHAYLCFGFPNSKNKKINPDSKRIKPLRLPYWSTPITPPRALLEKLKVTGKDHMFIDFDKKHSLDEAGRRVDSPKTDGMSGGAVIDLGNVADPAQLAEKCRPLLAGLFIEFHREHGAIVATRLDVILRDLRKRGSVFSCRPAAT